MKTIRPLLALVLAAALPLPALAQPHKIAQLGTAPLIGQISSTSQLKSDVSRERRLFETAGTKLGLSPDEYAKFSSRIAAGNLTYVTIPRHLDAMSWASGGNVYVLHDVVIPRGTKGWEVDLAENDQTIAVFVPARCGNLSVVRRPRPHIAKVPAVKAIAAAPVAATPAPAPAPVVESARAFVPPPSPQPTPAAYAAVAQSTPTHHFRLWPLLLIPIAALLVSGHGGGGGVPSITTSRLPPPPPAPTPPPAGCTPAPAH